MIFYIRGTTQPSYYTTVTTMPRNIHPPLSPVERQARRNRIVLEEKPHSPEAWAVLNPHRMHQLRERHSRQSYHKKKGKC